MKKFTFKNTRDIPDGAYQVKLVAAAESEGKFGVQAKFTFAIISGAIARIADVG